MAHAQDPPHEHSAPPSYSVTAENGSSAVVKVEENGMCGNAPVKNELKRCLLEKFEDVYEGIPKAGRNISVNKIYTKLLITGESDSANEHEVGQIESASRAQTTRNTGIDCNDIFEPRPEESKRIKTVLTKGIAGIGKTVSVQKFIVDWAKGKANEHVDFLFVLPFRELNLIKDELSLIGLLQKLHSGVEGIEHVKYNDSEVILIFDGLDESKLELNFKENKILSDVTELASLDILLTNIIKRSLLPHAFRWITSRPAAAGLIPSDCVHRVTEIQGFQDEEKEEYFKKRLCDQKLADAVLSHLKSSRSLYIMCYIPVFCWISATVLKDILRRVENVKIPTTLTQMYTEFVLLQTSIKNQKYRGDESDCLLSEPDRDIILKLGQLAYQHLEKNSLTFIEKDVKDCGIDVKDAALYSGVCTEILKVESVRDRKVYCFIHLSIQEFFAALYVHHLLEKNDIGLLTSFFKIKSEALTGQVSLVDLLKGAVEKAVNSEKGHLDLFLRFLFGLSQDSNRCLIENILPQTNNSESNKKITQYIKSLKRRNISPERYLNLIHCLVELGVNGPSFVSEIQMQAGSGSTKPLSPYQCSELAYVLRMSEEDLDEFDLRKYNIPENGLMRLLPVMKNSRKTLTLRHINLGRFGVDLLCKMLCSDHCKLQTLDLSNNDLGDSAVKLLCPALSCQDCKLQTLRLSGCQVTQAGCAALVSAVCSKPSHLRELDLSYNHPEDAGVERLFTEMQSRGCKLK
ncbi:protein NLRC3-like [Megalops cyprinoides]|uniref:protein NLRC3-like n=1 Tax=Megalops cyprinoides TaxID=118141 RepID=UPI0018654AFE|nr:protein NLRC3-like [Megalops cyprinoides]